MRRALLLSLLISSAAHATVWTANGFDNGASLPAGWLEQHDGGTVSYPTSGCRTAPACGKQQINAGGQDKHAMWYVPWGQISTTDFYVRAAWKFPVGWLFGTGGSNQFWKAIGVEMGDSPHNVNRMFVNFNNDVANSPDAHVRALVESSWGTEHWVGYNQGGTEPSISADGLWHTVEVHWVRAVGEDAGHVQVWFDEALFIDSPITTCNTENNGAVCEQPHYLKVGFYQNWNSSSSHEYYLDDITVSDQKFGSSPSNSHEWYVSPAGNDSNDGHTLATAFRTIAPCIAKIPAGDTCQILTSTYTGTPTSNDVPLYNVCAGASGTDSSHKTRYVAYPGNLPKFCINGTCDTVGAGSGALLGAAAGFAGAPTGPCHDIEFDGISVDGGYVIKGESWAGMCSAGATTNTTGTTSGSSAYDPPSSCFPGGTHSPEVLVPWTAPATGTVTATTCGSGTSFDTLLHLRDSNGAVVTTAGACNDDDTATFGCKPHSTITWQATAGSTWNIVVDGYNGAQGTFALAISSGAGGSCANNGACTNGSCVGAFNRVRNITVQHGTFEGGARCDGDYAPVRIENADHVSFHNNVVTGLTTTGCSSITNAALVKVLRVYDLTFHQNSLIRGSGASGYGLDVADTSVRGAFTSNRTDLASRFFTAATAGYSSANVFRNDLFAAVDVPARADGSLWEFNTFVGNVTFSDHCSTGRDFGSATNEMRNSDFLSSNESRFGKDSWAVFTGWKFDHNAYLDTHLWKPNRWANSPGSCDLGGDSTDSSLTAWASRITALPLAVNYRETGSIEVAAGACPYVSTTFAVFDRLYEIASGDCTTSASDGHTVGVYGQSIDCVGAPCDVPATPVAPTAPPHRAVVVQ